MLAARNSFCSRQHADKRRFRVGDRLCAENIFGVASRCLNVTICSGASKVCVDEAAYQPTAYAEIAATT